MELSIPHRRLRQTHRSLGVSDKEHARTFREPVDVSRDRDRIDLEQRDRNRKLGDDTLELRDAFLQLDGAHTAFALPDRSSGGTAR